MEENGRHQMVTHSIYVFESTYKKIARDGEWAESDMVFIRIIPLALSGWYSRRQEFWVDFEAFGFTLIPPFEAFKILRIMVDSFF